MRKTKFKLTKEENKLFVKKGMVDIFRLYVYRLGKAKSEQNDKWLREGRFDLIEWL